jgi:hypothetical protein
VQTVEHTDACGHLSMLKRDENEFVQPGNRIPRITNASWRYADGGVGQFLHGVVLHGEPIGLLQPIGSGLYVAFGG